MFVRKGAFELTRRDVVQTRPRILLGHIVDRDVQATELPDCPADRLTTEGLAAHVSGDPKCAHAALLHEANRLACTPCSFR